MNNWVGKKYIGYPCMNKTLRESTPPVRANRGLQMNTLEEKGTEYVSTLVIENLRDLLHILQWNKEHDIYFYRCSSNLFPKVSQYTIRDLPQFDTIKDLCEDIGAYIIDNEMRFSFHPDYWVKLASPTESTAKNARESIENHARILELFGLDASSKYPINIHIGAHYSDKDATGDRFIESYKKLSTAAQSHLVVENDDKDSLWSVKELYSLISESTYSIPLTFDYHHHQFADRGLTYFDAFELAKETWPTDIPPVTHYSEPARLYNNSTVSPTSHADSVSNLPLWLVNESSVMIESGSKEKSVLKAQRMI